jgi:hypothetical protein
MHEDQEDDLEVVCDDCQSAALTNYLKTLTIGYHHR